MRRRPLLLAFALVVLTLPAFAARNPKEVLLGESYLPVTAADQALTAVPFAPGARGVVLLEALQTQWQGVDLLHIHYMRRVKVLTDEGAAQFAACAVPLQGGWRFKKGIARVVLPGGGEVDASASVRTSTSAAGYPEIRVDYPQVKAGAILDLHLNLDSPDALAIAPWMVQGPLPVLESRFIMIPPQGLQYVTYVNRMAPELNDPEEMRAGAGTARVWTFKEIEPFPSEPFPPVLVDVGRRLTVVVEGYEDLQQRIIVAPDWKRYGERMRSVWEAWLKRGRKQADALGKQVAQGATDLERAAAVRKALLERIKVEHISAYAMRESADDLLKAGSGTTADLAAAMVVLLRSAGVPADLAMTRHRSQGAMAPERPVPGMFDDLLVRLPGGVLVSPAAATPPGTLPPDLAGVLVLPLDGAATAALVTPEVKPEENRTVRDVRAEVQPDGSLKGEASLTFHGAAAARWRERLAPLDEAARTAQLDALFQATMPGAKLSGVAFEAIADPAADLVARARFEAPAYATAKEGGKELNPILLDRFGTAEWAAETRSLPLNLGPAREESDTFTVKLAEGLHLVQIPSSANLSAEPAGSYKSACEKKDDGFACTRTFRQNLSLLAAESYAGIRAWFTTIAEAEARPARVSP